MIISYKNNFIFIRIPKAGSTSASAMIYDSGVLDKDIDICFTIDSGSFSKKKGANIDTNGLKTDDNTGRAALNMAYNRKLVDEKLLGNYFSTKDKAGTHLMHTTWSMLDKNNLIETDMICYSTIRHPVDRFISICYFVSAGIQEWPGVSKDDKVGPTLKNNLNNAWDRFKNNENIFSSYHGLLSAPQYYFLNESPILWNIENLFDWIELFVNKYGGSVKNYIWAKNQNRPKNFTDTKIITADRQKEIITHFEKDFLLWEKSYRRFN